MDKWKRIAALAGLAGALTAAAVLAQDDAPPPEAALTHEEAITARKALMASNSATRAPSLELPIEDAAEAAELLADNYRRIPLLFPEGSTAENSRALPAIWENWDDFVAIAERGQAEALEAAELARAGDKAGFDAIVTALPCSECHDRFRAP